LRRKKGISGQESCALAWTGEENPGLEKLLDRVNGEMGKQGNEEIGNWGPVNAAPNPSGNHEIMSWFDDDEWNPPPRQIAQS
jgi:hypothetical protein